MLAGKTVPAARKALTAKPRRVRVINRYSPLVLPGRIHDCDFHQVALRHSLVKHYETRKSSAFLWPKDRPTSVGRVTHEPGGVKLCNLAKMGRLAQFQPYNRCPGSR